MLCTPAFSELFSPKAGAAAPRLRRAVPPRLLAAVVAGVAPGDGAATPRRTSASTVLRAGAEPGRQPKPQRRRSVTISAGASDSPMNEPPPPKPTARDAEVELALALATLLRSSASVLGFIVLGTFAFVLLQSSVRTPLAHALGSADVLVTAVFAVGGWAFVRFLDNVNQRFNSADQRLDAVEKSLQELKKLVLQALPTTR